MPGKVGSCQHLCFGDPFVLRRLVHLLLRPLSRMSGGQIAREKRSSSLLVFHPFAFLELVVCWDVVDVIFIVLLTSQPPRLRTRHMLCVECHLLLLLHLVLV